MTPHAGDAPNANNQYNGGLARWSMHAWVDVADGKRLHPTLRYFRLQIRRRERRFDAVFAV
jgi:hypothetical protein